MTLNLQIDYNDPESSFKRIASELMNEWLLSSNGYNYRIAEIEFYFHHVGLPMLMGIDCKKNRAVGTCMVPALTSLLGTQIASEVY